MSRYRRPPHQCRPKFSTRIGPRRCQCEAVPISLPNSIDYPCEHCCPHLLRDRHAGHENDLPGKEFDAIGRKCVASCVAGGGDARISSAKRRLFAFYPRHFTAALPSLVRACCLYGPSFGRAASRNRAVHGPGGSFSARHSAAVTPGPRSGRAPGRIRPKARRWSKCRPWLARRMGLQAHQSWRALPLGS